MAGAVLLLCGAAIAAWSYWFTAYHFRVVDPGRLYRSGTLSAHELAVVRRRTGFRTIVNLRSTKEYAAGTWCQTERDFAAANGIRLVNIPLRPDTPPSPEQLAEFIAVASSPASQPVLIHCEAGVIRTGIMVAAYQVLVQGKDSKDVLKRLPMFGHHMEKRPQVRDYILNLGAQEPAAAQSR
jgi:protein tyrosine/serine phosphatase